MTTVSKIGYALAAGLVALTSPGMVYLSLFA
jgi:hypothetical protein